MFLFEIFYSSKNLAVYNSPKIYFENDVAWCQRKCSNLIRCQKQRGVQRLVSEIDPRDPSTFLKSANYFTVNLSGRKILMLRISGNDLESFENPLDFPVSVSLASRSSFCDKYLWTVFPEIYFSQKILNQARWSVNEFKVTVKTKQALILNTNLLWFHLR